MFEYMAAKNPIIASNLPSVKEVLIDSFNSLLTKPGDYRNLASKIEILFKQPTLGKKLAEQAFLEVSTKYTWIKRGMAELEFLQNLQKQ
jgi:glycosyltransferase involved in cell wall biosynthesis